MLWFLAFINEFFGFHFFHQKNANILILKLILLPLNRARDDRYLWRNENAMAIFRCYKLQFFIWIRGSAEHICTWNVVEHSEKPGKTWCPIYHLGKEILKCGLKLHYVHHVTLSCTIHANSQFRKSASSDVDEQMMAVCCWLKHDVSQVNTVGANVDVGLYWKRR